MPPAVPNVDAARQRVEESLNRTYGVPDDRLVIGDELTQEKPYGWIFSYQSARFLESGDLTHALAGNGPVVILKADGSIHQLGSAEDPETTIARFEASQGLA